MAQPTAMPDTPLTTTQDPDTTSQLMTQGSSQVLADEIVEEQEALILPPRQNFKDPSWMTKNAGRCIGIIAQWELEADTEAVTSTGGYEFLCNYSWKQTAKPTIYVPGTPARWTHPLLPKQLERDGSFYWCDQHGHRVPRHQFESVFQALALMNPTVRFNDVGIVVNRNTLQKLYNFASFKRGSSQFYVDLDMVQNTLFVSRREAKAKRFQHSGCGRNFGIEFTTEGPQLQQAEGHHREDDNESPDEFFHNVLGTILQRIINHHSPCPIVVLAQGTLMPHNYILELKSKSSKAAAFEQLWFGRTRHICCAKHRKGSKALIEAADIVHPKENKFEEWDIKNRKHLRRLAWLLGKLKRTTVEKTSKGSVVLVVTEKSAPFHIYEAKHLFGALPTEIVD